LHEAIEVLSTKALGRERVDWKSVERELAATLREDESPRAAHASIEAAVAKLGDPHASYKRPTPSPHDSPPPQPLAKNTNPMPAPAPQPPRPAIPTKPEGRMLDDGVAYLVVPGCTVPDVNGLRDFARAAAAELKRLEASHPKAWVIDLRLNGGGNLWPMLLGLRPLLGDGPLMTMVQGDKVESHFGVGPIGSWIDWGGNRGPEVQLDWGGAEPETIAPFKGRIAVLLGSWTMSSGESLTICFAGRQNTRTFGEKTAGLTTVTNFFPLSDGSVLNLPVSRMGDRRGREVKGSIEPMQAVAFGDWPTPDDDTARAARAWAIQQP